MLFLKAITTEGSTEYFNIEKILTIKPCGNNFEDLKILMGAGLYWIVKANTVEIVELNKILGGLQNEQLSKTKGKSKVKGG